MLLVNVMRLCYYGKTMIFVIVPVTAVLISAAVWIGTKSIKKRIMLNKKLAHLLDCREQYDFLLCDIRSVQSYEAGHLPGAVSFPADEVDYLPAEDMFLTIIICGRNRRDTRRAAEYLSCNGYFNVMDFGSVRHWKGPLEKGRGMHISQIPSIKEPRNESEFCSSGI